MDGRQVDRPQTTDVRQDVIDQVVVIRHLSLEEVEPNRHDKLVRFATAPLHNELLLVVIRDSFPI